MSRDLPEHPIDQPIRAVLVSELEGGGEHHAIGTRINNEVITHFEAAIKSGMYSNIPYVRAWAGDKCLAEFCQHNIVGVYFGAPTP